MRAALAPPRLRVSFVGPLLAHVLTLIPLLSPRRQRDRQARRWERLIDRRLQNTEIIALFLEIQRQARIAYNPDVSEEERFAAARRIDELAQEGVKLEREDDVRDDQDAGELRLVDREVGDLARAYKVLEQRALAGSQSWRPGDRL